MTPGILPFAAPRPASLFAPLLRRSAQKVTKKARHRTRRSDPHRANRTALRFSARRGCSDSTSMYCFAIAAIHRRDPSGIFPPRLRCSAPRTAPVYPRIRASLHCVLAIVRVTSKFSQEQIGASDCFCRRMPPKWGPCGAASAWRKSPKGRAQDAREGAARTWMCAQRPPEPAREPGGQDARRPRHRGCVSLVTFFAQVFGRGTSVTDVSGHGLHLRARRLGPRNVYAVEGEHADVATP